jgi:hypothetical protein
MGRATVGEIPDQGADLHLRRLAWEDGAYDTGGAYWGAGSTKEESIFWLYTVDESFQRFYRAKTNQEAVACFRAEANCAGHAIRFDSVEPSQDAYDFLATLLFTYPDPNEMDEEPDEDTFRATKHTAYDFAPGFILSLEGYLKGLRQHLETNNLGTQAIECDRTFGGNVYFSLSGHGCGFAIDEGEVGAKLEKALVAYTEGDTHRFEGIDLDKDSEGQINLALLPEYLADGIAQLFKHT